MRQKNLPPTHRTKRSTMMNSSSSAAARTARHVGRAASRRRIAASRRPMNRWVAPVLRNCVPSVSYSTERILQLKTGLALKDQPKTLYAPDRETENCGVGLVASLKSVASRKVVEDADEMLVRMSHRGGCGCDPASGDGAGTFLRVIPTLLMYNGFALHIV